MPTHPSTAWDLEVETARDDTKPGRVRAGMTFPFNLTGQPAISIPCGVSQEGLPVGLQVVAQSFQDWRLLDIAEVFEFATGMRDLRPSLRI